MRPARMDPRLREDDEWGWRPNDAQGISHLVRTVARLHCRHSYEGGIPAKRPACMDPRLRGDNECGCR